MLNLFFTAVYSAVAVRFISRPVFLPTFWSTGDVVVSFVYGLLTVNLTAFFLSLLLRRNHWLRRVVGLLLLDLFLVLSLYHLDRKFSVDVNLILSNFTIAFSSNSMHVIASIFR